MEPVQSDRLWAENFWPHYRGGCNNQYVLREVFEKMLPNWPFYGSISATVNPATVNPATNAGSLYSVEWNGGME